MQVDAYITSLKMNAHRKVGIHLFLHLLRSECDHNDVFVEKFRVGLLPLSRHNLAQGVPPCDRHIITDNLPDGLDF